MAFSNVVRELFFTIVHSRTLQLIYNADFRRIQPLIAGDGGKWICSPYNLAGEGCAILSLGINNEISFETELQSITDNRCELYAVDKSEQEAAVVKRLESINGKFMKGTLGAVLNTTANLITLDHVIQKYGIKSIEILKIDIEDDGYRLDSSYFSLQEIAKRGYYLFAHEVNMYDSDVCEYSFIHSSCLDKYSAHLLANYLS
ncbi:unnamed protein product [Anisakis simplex]|uniref:Methyltranfer_dom domain-containing protein n=1 Tax=Anisakis simplex TaxID=6269 RepID=A0A158PPH1_ANISI|nr:unnamed protein product [Anisakis simplex]